MSETRRSTIRPKVRFEVFKRDSFCCQYCGRSAPDVILQVDHITPVSKGGDESILNYVTSCWDCNIGKGNRELSDGSILEKQRAQLEELNERRCQLELMLQWREALEGILEGEVEIAVQAINNALASTKHSLNENGVQDVCRWVKKYGLPYVLDGVDGAKLKVQADDPGDYAATFIDLVGGIARTSKRSETQPNLKDFYYIRGILRRRLRYVNERDCLRLLESAVAQGVTVEELKDIARDATSWDRFEHTVAELMEPI